jgi:nitroreductase
MDLCDLLRRRRMVRAYRAEPVDRATLERIVSVIRHAPSAGFSQGQRLLVVTDADTRRRMVEILGGEYYRGEYPHWLDVVPVQIVVCTREQDYHDRYRQPDKLVDGDEVDWVVPYWWFDAGALEALLHLAALDEGLAAGVYGIPEERLPAFKDVLGIPDNVAVACVLTVGYPEHEHEPGPDRSSRGTWPRKPLDEVVRWERWSS